MKISRDLKSNVKVVHALNSALTTATTDTDGSAVDLMGYGSALLVAQTGVVTLTDTTITLTVQESDTSTASDFTNVADADLIGTEAADFLFSGSIANSVKKIGYKGLKRYVRVRRAGAASATGIVGAIAILGTAEDAPVA
jgi:hypothetical protein